jgi:hypothetical protein
MAHPFGQRLGRLDRFLNFYGKFIETHGFLQK